MARVYVSSTYFDLLEFRERVHRALRKMRHDDVTMEYYVAEVNRPLERGLEDVASSDIFIGLVAWRYGWVPEENNPEGLSIPEIEYRHAMMHGKPCLMFLLDEDTPWPPKFIDSDTKPIEAFREKVLSRNVVHFFNSPDELEVAVVQAIHQAENLVRDGSHGPAEAPRATGKKLNLPEPPEELIRACAGNECVVYVGSGLSAEMNLPTWSLFISGLLKWARDAGRVAGDFADSLKEAVENGDIDLVADSLVNALGPHDEALNKYLVDTFYSSHRTLPERHTLLRAIPFCAALTTNFDDLLEMTFLTEAANRIYTHKDTEALLSALSTRAFFVLKLYGTLERPETVLIAPAQYQAAVAENLVFSQFMQSLFYSRTLLFLGASLDGIGAYLSGLKFRGTGTPRQHYALVDVSGSAWKVKADLLKRRYGIEVLPYTASEGYPELTLFLKRMVSLLPSEKEKAASGVATGVEEERPASWLQRLRVENIGPFVDQSFDFTRGWNVLFGDNGVGKSSILKAIAVGLCGQEAKSYAKKLIKADHSKATITFDIASEAGGKIETRTYITHLLRTGTGVEVESIPTRALEAENMLSLGFPPLRAITEDKSSRGRAGKKERPDAGDLLPLITGEPDWRLDELKNWIIELDHIAKSEKDEGVRRHTAQLIEEFFEVVRELTPGVSLELEEIDVQGKRIMVRTQDGVIPIDYVSQGTSSLIGWIGVLLRRLFEMYGDRAKPRAQYALVLIDELDAHMHPLWQQHLPVHVRSLFPAAQVIATTHSPLLVPFLNVNEIFSIRRDPASQRVVVERPKTDFHGYRADQILTSSLFRLVTSRDPKTYEKIMEYSELAFREDLDEKEQARLKELAKEIKGRLHLPAEREEARITYNLIRDAVTQEIEKMDYEDRGKILNEVKAQLLGLTSGSGRGA